MIYAILLEDENNKEEDNISQSSENANEADDRTEYLDETSIHNLNSTDKPQGNSEEDIDEEEDTESSKDNMETETRIENENGDGSDYDKDNLSSQSGVVSKENGIRSVEGLEDGLGENQNKEQTKLRSVRKDEKENDPASHNEHDNESEEEGKSDSLDTDETEKPKNFTVKSSNEESGKLLIAMF